MDFAVAVEAFADHLEKVRRLSPATVKAYRSDLRDLGASIGGGPVDHVDLEMLREWLWQPTQRGDARAHCRGRGPHGCPHEHDRGPLMSLNLH